MLPELRSNFQKTKTREICRIVSIVDQILRMFPEISETEHMIHHSIHYIIRLLDTEQPLEVRTGILLPKMVFIL